MSRGFRDMGLSLNLRGLRLRSRQCHSSADFHLEDFYSRNAPREKPHFSKAARSGAPEFWGLYQRYTRPENWAARHSSSFIAAPTGFALERLRDAKRVYEKTKTGRARDAGQELHHAERSGADDPSLDLHHSQGGCHPCVFCKGGRRYEDYASGSGHVKSVTEGVRGTRPCIERKS